MSRARRIRQGIAIGAVLMAAGCAGGGCSSCTTFTPLPNGFPSDKRVENAGSARITRSGLDFLGQNLGKLASGILGSSGGVVPFTVPTSTNTTSGISYTICPNGADANGNPKICTAEIDLGNAHLTIDPLGPSDLRIYGTIPVRAQDIQVSVALGICTPTVNVALDGDGTCPGGSFDTFPLDVDIQVHVDQNPNHTARFGYSQISIQRVVDQTAATDNLKQSVQVCGIASCDALCCATDFCTCALAGAASGLKSTLIDALAPTVIGFLEDTIDQTLCQKTNPALSPSCPAGSSDSSGICKYADGTCASTLLGLDGHGDLGSLLASLSPGTQADMDFLFAAGGASKSDHDTDLSWGDLDPTPVDGTGKGQGGVTLGMIGGAEPSPISKCIKPVDLVLPTAIPIPTELYGETVTDWPAGTPGPHLGLAVSERFANHALGGAYNSGLFCVGVSTENLGLLSSGTIGLLAPSSKALGLQSEPQQVAIALRPSGPPTIAFGNGTDLATDPLVRVKLSQVAIDFYIFSDDRFIRFMTATYDLDIPANLTVGPDGLEPTIDQIGVANGKVTNSELLSDKPEDLATAIGNLLGSLVGQELAGTIPPIDLNKSLSSLGVDLVIPDTADGKGSPGLRKLTKGQDNYLGVFASFELPSNADPLPAGAFTSAKLEKKLVELDGLALATATADNAPYVEIEAASDLDDGTRVIEYQYKVDQGFWHPFTKGPKLAFRDEWLRVQGDHTIHVRSRVAGQPRTLDPVPAQVAVHVDAKDVAGGKVELIRGRADAASAAGCGCEVAGSDASSRLGYGAWLFAAAVGAVGLRRRSSRRRDG